MGFEPIEERRMYQRAETVADQVWNLVSSWDRFARNAVGEQFVTAADSIGANIAEAGGRFHPGDVIKFLYYSRGSLREAKYWLRRCSARGLVATDLADRLDAELEQLSKEINATIRHQRERKAGG